jgi:hypothetical protein
MTYADILEQAYFAKLHDNYFWREISQARREADINHQSLWIADEVIQNPQDSARRAEFIEELVDDESFAAFIGDLLDDVNAGTDPTERIKRRVASWSQTVAEYEIERGEA